MKKIMRHLAIIFCSTFALTVLLSCVSTKVETFGDDEKIIYSTKMLKINDFYFANFFTVESMTPSFWGFDTQIFMMIKEKIANGSAKGAISAEGGWRKEYAKKGEMIDFFPAGEEYTETYLIIDAIYDKNTKCFIEYNFALTVFEDVYAKYIETREQMYSYIDKCRQNVNSCIENMSSCDANIKKCNDIISTCSNPTIQKSRVVSVPYTVTERYWVPGSTGVRTDSSFGSIEGTPSHSETRQYTAYRNETEYYTVPNPNYNPSAVNKAKSDIQYWNKEKIKWNNEKESWNNKKDKTYTDLGNLPLPFVLEAWSPSDEID